MSVSVDRVRQRDMALGKANRCRSVRAKLKRLVAAGRVDVGDLILAPPWWLESMVAADLLLAVPKWGNRRVLVTLKQCGVSPFVTVGGLTDRQRRALVEAVQ